MWRERTAHTRPRGDVEWKKSTEMKIWNEIKEKYRTHSSDINIFDQANKSHNNRAGGQANYHHVVINIINVEVLREKCKRKGVSASFGDVDSFSPFHLPSSTFFSCCCRTKPGRVVYCFAFVLSDIWTVFDWIRRQFVNDFSSLFFCRQLFGQATWGNGSRLCANQFYSDWWFQLFLI